MGKKDKNKKNTIGYGNPPKHSQFKPGQSGNPTGRPKGSVSVASVVAKIGDQKVTVVENGKTKIMTKLEVVFSALLAAGATGNVSAAKLISDLTQEVDQPDANLPEDSFDEKDAEILLGEIEWKVMLQKLQEESDND